MKRILSAILCAFLLTACLPARAELYPDEWTLSDLYPSREALDGDFDAAMAMCLGLDAFRGRLKEPGVLLELDEYTTDLSRLLDRLRVYAELLRSLNPSDPEALGLSARFAALSAAMSEHFAFFDAEVAGWPYEDRLSAFTAGDMAPCAYAYRQYTKPDYEPLSEDEATVLGLMAGPMDSVQSAYDALLYAELPPAVYEDEDGKTTALTDENYSFLYAARYLSGDRDGALALDDALNAPCRACANTFSALLSARARYNQAVAKLEGYESTRLSQMDVYDVPEEVYSLVMDAYLRGEDPLHRYVSAHAAAMGAGEGEAILMDVMMPLSDSYKTCSYDQCVNRAREVLSVLGDEYIACCDAMVSSGHIDVYPSDTKITGSFEISCADPDTLPYILLNFQGADQDVSVFVHEMGHAIYDILAAKYQWYGYAAPGIFTQEVASTVNQTLFYLDLLDSAASDDERLCALEQLISNFVDTYYYQMILTEFEDFIYSRVEMGEALDAESLANEYLSIQRRVFGDVRFAPNSAYDWVQVTHLFESPYYVYQYATSVTYATHIALSIHRGDEGAAERYMDFLKAGASMGPRDLLSIVGVDITDPAVYDEAVSVFSGWVDEFVRLVK